ncbi:hypothetical protein SAMN04487761_11821 [Lachnospiraceae bacterium C7]|nr:hypothetical protein SAMN04487761_11821 [Lachnospiraceae bacterium C7]
MKLRKKKEFVFFSNFGISSIVLILIMMCFMTFATLTLLTARYDLNLSRKVASKNQNYLESETRANKRLSHIDETLLECYTKSSSPSEFYDLSYKKLSGTTGEFYDSFPVNKEIDSANGKSFYFKYSVKISQTQALNVVLQIKYPLCESDGFYSIKSWAEESHTTEQIDDTLNVYTGTEK